MNVCIIPARGRSTRIPRKNIKPFHGLPIISYSIDTARETGLFDGGIWVSTEDREIANAARALGAHVIDRPPTLAEIGAPDCGTQEVVRHALTALEGVKYACCIYATCPLLLPADIETGYVALLRRSRPFAYSICPNGKDAGQFYWGTRKAFMQRVPLTTKRASRICLPWDRAIDINTPQDWARAEAVYAQQHLTNLALDTQLAQA